MKYIFSFLLFIGLQTFAQQDYSRLWEDALSYSNVVDFDVHDQKLYGLTNNALFVNDIATNTNKKVSTINGLTADTKTKIVFDGDREQAIIASTNGLIEVYSKNGQIIPLTGITNNTIFTDKQINNLFINGNELFVAGNFGISVVNLNTLEFKETYVLSNTSLSTKVNACIQLNNKLYAATINGLYSIDLLDNNKNPLNFSDWTFIKSGEITKLITNNNQLYYVIDKSLYNEQTNTVVYTTPSTVTNISSSGNLVLLTNSSTQYAYDLVNNSLSFSITKTNITNATVNGFNTAKIFEDKIYLATSNEGVFISATNALTSFSQILVPGPKSNSPFKIRVHQNNLAICYGGYSDDMQAWNSNSMGIDTFFNNQWAYVPLPSGSGSVKISDIVDVNFSKNNTTRLYLSSFFYGSNLSGIYIYDFDATADKWNYTKKWDYLTTNVDNKNGLGQRLNVTRAQTSTILIDKNDDIWIASNYTQFQEIASKYNIETETWKRRVSFINELPSQYMFIKSLTDDDENLFACTTKIATGLLVSKKNTEGVNKVIPLDKLGVQPSDNSLNKVLSHQNKLWIATDSGLRVLDDYENLYSDNLKPAEKIVFEENGEAKELLPEAKVYDIEVDGIGNKWFATSQGVVFTTPNGDKTLALFNTTNSPLPDDNVVDIEIDETNSKVYFATGKGIVIYNSGVASYGTVVSEVIAYPNPCIQNKLGHDHITIVTKNNNGLPKGTNIKIIDVSGKLVYETNTTESQQSFGGKVIWDKKNLKGTKVVPGVYIVLVSSPDGTQQTSTKIAIIN